MMLNPAKRELLAQELLEAEGLAPEGRSLTRDALRRLGRNKAAVLSIAVLALLILAAFLGPWIIPFNYETRIGPPSASRRRSKPAIISALTRMAATFLRVSSTAPASRWLWR